MSYIKAKVDQTTGNVVSGTVLDTEELNHLWLNYIQTQLESFYDEYEDTILSGWRLCFSSKIFNPATSNILQVDGAIVGNPVIYRDGVRHTSWEKTTQEPDGSENFSYDRFDDKIYSEGLPIIGAVCVVYYYAIFPHAELHSVGELDAISVSNINGYTQTEIDAMFPDVPTGAEVVAICKSTKESSSSALVIRESSSYSSDELCDIGLPT